MESTQKDEEVGMHVDPQDQHRWLQKLVGEWTVKGEPPHETKGTESVRSIGEIWIQAEGHGEMPGGGEAHVIMTLGYDLQSNRFVGTWIGSMMTHLWVYNGELDESGRVLTLSAEGPSFDGDGTMAQYRDVIEIESDTLRILKGYVLKKECEWHHFMTTRYERTK